jgi:hypothetical protein
VRISPISLEAVDRLPDGRSRPFARVPAHSALTLSGPLGGGHALAGPAASQGSRQVGLPKYSDSLVAGLFAPVAINPAFAQVRQSKRGGACYLPVR